MEEKKSEKNWKTINATETLNLLEIVTVESKA